MDAEAVDVLIVGSGPVGATFARVISDERPELSILMVEVGPRLSDEPGQHVLNMAEPDRAVAQSRAQGPDADVRRTVVAGQGADGMEGMDPSLEYRRRALPGVFLLDPDPAVAEGEVGMPMASMSSCVGGMGVFWGTSTPRPLASERIAFIPDDEMDRALTAAESLLQVTTASDSQSPFLNAIRDGAAAEFDPDSPESEKVGFMPTASQRDGARVVFSGTSAILGDLGRGRSGFELRPETLARRVVVEDGVAVGVELQSRRSGERYQVRAQRVIVAADSLRTPQLLFASGVRPRALGHYLNEHFQVHSFINLNDRLQALEADEVAGNATGTVRIPFCDARPSHGLVASLVASPFRSSLPVGAPLTVASWYGRKDIQYRDAVEFSACGTDPYGMPALSIRYALTDVDNRTVAQMKQLSRRTASAVGSIAGEPQLAEIGSSLHYQGTVRMGPQDDGSSVCDQYLQVWGVQNLLVGGNGVIPTSTAANPTLTSVALAWRAAKHLSEGFAA